MIFLFVVTFVLILNIVFVNLFFCVCRWKCFSLFLIFFYQEHTSPLFENWAMAFDRRTSSLFAYALCEYSSKRAIFVIWREKTHSVRVTSSNSNDRMLIGGTYVTYDVLHETNQYEKKWSTHRHNYGAMDRPVSSCYLLFRSIKLWTNFNHWIDQNAVNLSQLCSLLSLSSSPLTHKASDALNSV